MKSTFASLIFGALIMITSFAQASTDVVETQGPATAGFTCRADEIATSGGCGVYSHMCAPGTALVGQTCFDRIQPLQCDPGANAYQQAYGYGSQGYQGYRGMNANGFYLPACPAY